MTSQKLRRSMDHSTPSACEKLERRVLLTLVAPVFHSHPGVTATLYPDFVGAAAEALVVQSADG